MPSFGERLRHEREARHTTIEEIARATGIHLNYLEALEKDEFQALPGRAFGKLYVRAYAETLGLDSRSLIDEYDREQRLRQPSSVEPSDPGPVRPRRVGAVIARWREGSMGARNRAEHGVASPKAGRPSELRCEDPPHLQTDAVAEVWEDGRVDVPQIEPVEARRDEAGEIEHRAPLEHGDVAAVVPVSEARPRIPKTASWSGRPLVAALLVFGLLAGAAGIYFSFRTGAGAGGPVSALKALPETPSAREADPVPAPEPPATAGPTRPEADPPVAPGHLTAPEFGVGRRIVKRRLEGREEAFAEGETAWFSTRVIGGKPGEAIRHVWLHESKVVQSIRLGLGSSDWRTHSSKTLRDTGQWVVEARDEEGRILARETFTCVPEASQAANRRTRLRLPSSR